MQRTSSGKRVHLTSLPIIEHQVLRCFGLMRAEHKAERMCQPRTYKLDMNLTHVLGPLYIKLKGRDCYED